MNVSGHRLSTTEIESALVSHPKVAEAAVVGATDPRPPARPSSPTSSSATRLGDGRSRASSRSSRTHVRKEIGPIAKPRQIMIVPELPKTRSGKIMRRLLRDVAEGRQVGDTQTLADASIMDLISAGQATSTED